MTRRALQRYKRLWNRKSFVTILGIRVRWRLYA